VCFAIRDGHKIIKFTAGVYHVTLQNDEFPRSKVHKEINIAQHFRRRNFDL